MDMVERRRNRRERRQRLVGFARTWISLHDQRAYRQHPAFRRWRADQPPLSHPRHELDELLGHPVRFSIVALLAAANRAEFSFVRDQVEVSDSVLSKQITALEHAGHVKVHKAFVGKRPRTWLSLSSGGRRAYRRHIDALRSIASGTSLARGALA